MTITVESNPSTSSIIDIRKENFTKQALINEIIKGLTPEQNVMKIIPTIMLYDDLGLQLFDQITFIDEYYLTNAEINILERKVDQIVDYIPNGSAVIELGSGSLRKTQRILKSLEAKKKDITYYALDLMKDELIKSLSSLGNFSSVKLVGLCGTYEEGMEYVSTLAKDQPKTIIWLGSSIGNLSREEGASFVRRFQAKVMNPGDMFLIGIDRRNPHEQVAAAYNDSLGITAKFIMNGLNHVNILLDQKLFNLDDFEYFSAYNKDNGKHNAYYRSKKDLVLEYVFPNDKNNKIFINIEADELIQVEHSYKYSKADTFQLFHESRMSHVESWSDSESQYDLHLIYKPPFYLRNQKSQESIPSVYEWQELWKSWDTVTMSMVPPDMMLEKPTNLRHPFIFYVGRIPLFLDVNLARYAHEKFTDPQDFSEIFERGIVPEQWPELNSIFEFRDKVRKRLLAVYDAHKNKSMSRSLGRVLWMTFEHEAIHLEAFLHMLMQSNNVLPPKGVITPHWRVVTDPAPKAKLITIPTQIITLGHDYNENADDSDPLNAPYGWDNESTSRQITVQSFKIQSRPVTNGEYLDFMKTTMNKEYPLSWIPSLFDYSVRTVFGPVNMDVAMNWPVMLSLDQANRYAEWKRMRLPTEEELRCLYDKYTLDMDVLQSTGLSHWHPTDVSLDEDVVQTFGNAWEWTSTEFAAFPGFIKSKIYPGYSSDFFDGKHKVVLGGSWLTHPRLLRQSFRNWFQYDYPNGSFRLCAMHD